MTTFDFSPLFRTSVGYDRLASLLNSAHRVEQGGGYPPYNILTSGENHYRITMAVAGFTEDELDITSEQNSLVISGRQQSDSDSRNYLHRGIATRDFERKFQLAEHVKVVSAKLENGLLHVALEREVPEEMKPRKIAIEGLSTSSLLEQNAA